MIKTRFAPSPTGELHIGSARTALFNYLFAKHNKGEFLLRIEDTDKERSSKKYEKNILDGLEWLGIAWNGKILYQSSRLDVYKSIAEELVKKGFAAEEDGAIILKAKETLDKLGIKFEEVAKILVGWEHEKMEKKSSAYLVKNIEVDLIHGGITGVIADTVLLRSSGTPTFHLAVVVDDEFMKITHVIR
ncbi:glutamate--tRNA ligase, partial [Candidatus Berkelbacteria bacterium CG_4_9_14_0_2_um_filter_42_30]